MIATAKPKEPASKRAIPKARDRVYLCVDKLFSLFVQCVVSFFYLLVGVYCCSDVALRQYCLSLPYHFKY